MSAKRPGKNSLENSSKGPPPAGGGGLARVVIDLNCDMGEGFDNDELIIPYISSASIACGYHAGDENTMKRTIELCLKYKVAIGAHVSFHDKENFGRKEINLPPGEIYELVQQQLFIFKEIADLCNTGINHVKPHGALYNMSARDVAVANAVARSVKDFDPAFILFGLSGSHSIAEAKSLGLKTASEVFADRTYQEDGSLTPRSQNSALINDTGKAIEQSLQMVEKSRVTTTSGKQISITAETICIHGDGKHAVEFAKNIYEKLKQSNIEVRAI